MEYAKVIKTAYELTRHYPRLWPFGLFLGSGFTFQLVSSSHAGLPDKMLTQPLLVQFLGIVGAHNWLLLLLVIILGLMVTNWVKVVLIQHVSILLKLDKRFELSKSENFTPVAGQLGFLHDPPQIQHGLTNQSRWVDRIVADWRKVIHVTAISIFTTLLLLGAFTVIYAPFITFARNSQTVPAVYIATLILAVFLISVVSCVSLFASLYVVLLRLPYKLAITLSSDLLIAKWYDVVGAVVSLVVIYTLAFLGGFGVLSLIFGVLKTLYAPVANFHLFGMIPLVSVITSILLWVWVGILNIFFYTAMIAFFSRIVTPKQDSAKAVELDLEVASA